MRAEIAWLCLLLGCGHASTPVAPREAPEQGAESAVDDDAIDHARPRRAEHEPHEDAPLASADARIVRWEPRREDSFERAARPNVDSCGADAAAAARHLELVDVTSCAVSTYVHGAERLTLVHFDYGPAQDCPSGCFQASAAAVVRDGSVVRVSTDRVAVSSPYSRVADYLRRELASRSMPVQPSPTHWYDFFTSEGWCASDPGRAVLESRGAAVYWAFDVPPTECTPRLAGPNAPRAAYDVTLEGRFTIPIVAAEGTSDAPDFTGMTLSVRPLVQR